MKKKPGFQIHSVCGSQFLIASGVKNIDFNSIINLNESAAFLWNAIADDEEFDADSLTKLILEEYDVEEAVARQDVEEFLQKLKDVGVID